MPLYHFKEKHFPVTVVYYRPLTSSLQRNSPGTPNQLQKANSCSTIFIDDNTVSQPNLRATLKWYGAVSILHRAQETCIIVTFWVDLLSTIAVYYCSILLQSIIAVCTYTDIFIAYQYLFSVSLAIYYHIKNR